MSVCYALKSGRLAPACEGFCVSRTYEALGDPAALVRATDDDEAGGDGVTTWRVKAGTLVRVALKVSTATARHHVALEDPLPAGPVLRLLLMLMLPICRRYV